MTNTTYNIFQLHLFIINIIDLLRNVWKNKIELSIIQQLDITFPHNSVWYLGDKSGIAVDGYGTVSVLLRDGLLAKIRLITQSLI